MRPDGPDRSYLLRFAPAAILAACCLFSLPGCDDTGLEPDGTPAVDPFTVFTEQDGLINAYVTDLAVDYTRRGLWCATYGGVSFYSFEDSTFVSYGAGSALPDLQVNAVAMDPFVNSVWAGTRSGAASLNLTTWAPLTGVLPNPFITDIESVPLDGSLWFATRGGLSRNNFQLWTTYSIQNGLPSNDTTAIEPVGSEVWVGTVAGIAMFDGSSWRQSPSGVLSSPVVLALYAAPDGRVWVGTDAGVTVYENGTWLKYGTADGLPAPGTNAFVRDRSGVLWAGTDGGLAQFTGNKFVKLELPDLITNDAVLSLAVDLVTGDLWIGTVSGLVRYAYIETQ